MMGFLNGLIRFPDDGLVRPDEFVNRLPHGSDDTATFRGTVADEQAACENATVYLSWLDESHIDVGV